MSFYFTFLTSKPLTYLVFASSNLQRRILVTKEFLEAVESNVLSQRPSSRVNAAKVNLQNDSVLLISDHSVFPHGSCLPFKTWQFFLFLFSFQTFTGFKFELLLLDMHLFHLFLGLV